jgi:protein-L-isoaspartate(D-aspartate) O-methyltransferase
MSSFDPSSQGQPSQDQYSQEQSFKNLREVMVREQLAARGLSDVRVLEAMRTVLRHEFVPEELRGRAYEDCPLAIGEGQTISQPLIVAAMLEHLALKESDRVLEVGAGSGYVTALLAVLCAQVFAVERFGSLAERARAAALRLNYRNVEIRTGDGTQGWAEHAPYDAILVSAATTAAPAALFEQLAEGGRMVAPVGPREAQELHLIRKVSGQRKMTVLGGCRFVPLVEGTVGGG